MKNINWSDVQEVQDYKKLVPGGYVCIITNVEDFPDKEYLKIEYDIAQGEFENHYQKLFESKSFWGGRFVKSYKDGMARSFFKGFLTALSNSNSGFVFDSNEKKLVGKYIGLVLGEEEYIKQDQTLGTRLYVGQIRSVSQIKSGEFEVPALKKVDGYNEPNPFGGQSYFDEPPF